MFASVSTYVNRNLSLDPEDFHLRRSRNAPQFKDESCTLRYVCFFPLVLVALYSFLLSPHYISLLLSWGLSTGRLTWWTKAWCLWPWALPCPLTNTVSRCVRACSMRGLWALGSWVLMKTMSVVCRCRFIVPMTSRTPSFQLSRTCRWLSVKGTSALWCFSCCVFPTHWCVCHSIESVKRRIAEHELVRHPASKLRLRERTSRTAGKIFRDTQSVRAAIRNLKDGIQICVELLDFVERTTRADMVLPLRLWSPLQRKIRRADVVVRRKSTVAELWDVLHSRFAIGEPEPSSGYTIEDNKEAGDADGAGDGTVGPSIASRLGAHSRAAREPASDGSSGKQDEPSSDGGNKEAPITQEEKEAASIAAALKRNPSGIGLVKMPTYPKLTLASVWKYKWNTPAVRSVAGNEYIGVLIDVPRVCSCTHP